MIGVKGNGWRTAWNIHEVYFSEYGRTANLQVFVQNGGSGRSKPGALLVNFSLSNSEARFKERIEFEPAKIQFRIGETTVQPNASMECARREMEELSHVPAFQEIPPGDGKCLTLMFPVDPPNGESSFQITIPRLRLGEQEFRDITITFGKIHG